MLILDVELYPGRHKEIDHLSPRAKTFVTFVENLGGVVTDWFSMESGTLIFRVHIPPDKKRELAACRSVYSVNAKPTPDIEVLYEAYIPETEFAGVCQ